jgi:hypothetical protein
VDNKTNENNIELVSEHPPLGATSDAYIFAPSWPNSLSALASPILSLLGTPFITSQRSIDRYRSVFYDRSVGVEVGCRVVVSGSLIWLHTKANNLAHHEEIQADCAGP